MRTTKLLFLGVSLLAGASTAAAQIPAAQPWEGRGYFHVSFGGQSQEQTFTDSATFDIFSEQGASAAGHSVGGGNLFDIAAGARVWKNVGVGLAYSANKNKNDAVVTVRVPHPILFGQSREATATATDLKHSENAVHLQLMWILPLTSRFQLALMVGPSFFTVRQNVAAPIRSRNEITDVAPFTSVSIRELQVTEYKDSPVGVNVGVDGTYLITTYSGVGIGVGGFVRYSGASLDLDIPTGTTRDDNDLKVGGPQGGVGLRLRF